MLSALPALHAIWDAADGAQGYEGEGGPAKWGEMDAANKVCSIGSQQSPIDIFAHPCTKSANQSF